MRAKIEEIRAWLGEHEEELISDLARLVAIPSVSRPESPVGPYGEDCRRALDELLFIGKKYGFETKNYEYHVGSIELGGSGRPKSGVQSIGIWNHLDVVAEGEGWSFPPYKLVRKGDFLVGRGVQDNKGPALGSLYALRYLKEACGPLRHDYRLYAGCSEENGMLDADYFVKHYQAADFNLVADCGFPVCHGEKGILNVSFSHMLSEDSRIVSLEAGSSINSIPASARLTLKKRDSSVPLPAATERIAVCETRDELEITAAGTACHVGFPEGSVNAIEVLASWLLKSGLLTGGDETLFRFLSRIDGDVYGKGAGIACEDKISGALCGAATLIRTEGRRICIRADYRYPISIGNAQRLIKGLEKTADDYGITVRLDKDEAPYYLDEDHPGVKALMRVYREITGSKRQAYTMSGGTYARKLPQAVSYGMSLENKRILDEEGRRERGDCHQPDESLELGQYLEGIAIYIASLLELDEAL